MRCRCALKLPIVYCWNCWICLLELFIVGMSGISSDETPPSLAATGSCAFTPIIHLWTAFSSVVMIQTGQIWHFWNLHGSRIRLIPFLPGKNVFFLKWKIFLLHFFTEEINIFQNLFAEIYFLTTRIDSKWENLKMM